MNPVNKARREAAAERDQQMRELLAAQTAGISREQAAKMIGITISEARRSLYRLQYAQQAVFTPSVRGSIGQWCRPDLALVVLDEKIANRADVDRRRRERDGRGRPERVAKRQEAARKAADIVDGDDGYDGGEGAKPFIRRIVRASEAPCIVTRGVPSVFHLGYQDSNARAAA